MKAIRFTKVEADLIETAMGAAWDLWGPALGKTAIKASESIRQKLKKAQTPSTNVAVQPIEDALIAGARGKVVALVEGHAQASVQAGRLGVTPEKAYEVGQYLARTKWLTGPFTLLDVLMKWPTYYSKAQATQPPPSAPAGFGGTHAEAQQGTPREGQGIAGRRSSPGFR